MINRIVHCNEKGIFIKFDDDGNELSREECSIISVNKDKKAILLSNYEIMSYIAYQNNVEDYEIVYTIDDTCDIFVLDMNIDDEIDID